ncbi:MAG TPA: ATP-binding protein [Candidatus Binatia bacterium]|nr:ATP-binding protein [Candidatus Binatia bacterium]
MNIHDTDSGFKISWEQALASLEDGVVIVDREGKIAFFNESAEVLTDLSASRALHQPFSRLFKREPWLLRLLKKSCPPRQESLRGEGEVVDRWGRKVPVGVTVSPLQDRFGKFLGSILLLRNLVHRRELEEDLKRADRLAMVGTFAAGLAHEIRNPLGGIRGAAQLLRRSLDEAPSLLEYTDIMIREVDRVDQLIEQLLDLSRPAQLALTPLNIHQILEDVLLLQIEPLAPQRITVRKRFDPSLPPVRGDKAQLTQVFLNLVKNALQAMNASGTLTITTRAETDFHIRHRRSGRRKFIWVDVEDRGSGIKEDDLPHIFSPFFTTKNNGTGLGLAICYRIVKEHGGLIRVESTEGKGTTFKVSLVVAE